MILERKLKFPLELDICPEAKDLIDKLLQLEPTNRLGAGSKGSDNDYSALKNHLFFKDFDFSRTASMKINLDKILPITDDL